MSRWLAHLCHDGAVVFWLHYTNEGSDEGWTVVRQTRAKKNPSLEKARRVEVGMGTLGVFSSGASFSCRGKSWRVGGYKTKASDELLLPSSLHHRQFISSRLRFSSA